MTVIAIVITLLELIHVVVTIGILYKVVFITHVLTIIACQTMNKQMLWASKQF